MKELSIEKKAKAYDNIIEKANKMYSENCEACQMCIEELIPELKESEDEKIRKALIEGFKVMKDGSYGECTFSNYNIPVTAIIAWIEKQGEQKIQRCGVSCFTDIVQAIRTVYNEESAYDLTDYLTELANKKEQKPAWSEEDKRMINKLLAVVKLYYAKDGDDLDKQSCSTWLKSLRPQNRWKESLATADLENSLCDIQDAFSDTSYEYRILGEAIEFIRCTEPKLQWKPSELQIEALESTAENCAYSEYQDCLRELIRQLKKLK